MASACISSCLNDVAVHLPTTTSLRYARLSVPDQPETPGESGRFASFEERCRGHPKVVDSISCRQLYLRSYTFSRKESFSDKTKRCVGKVTESVKKNKRKDKKKKKKKGSAAVVVRRRNSTAAMICLRKASKVTCTAVMKVVRRLLMSCTTRVNTAAD